MKYYKYKIENLIKVNKIVTVHHFRFDKDFKSKPESHDFWELVYAEKNSLVCFNGNLEHTLNTGEITFFKPNTEHHINADGNNPPNAIIVSFECKSEALNFFSDKILKLNPENLKYLYSVVNESKRTFDIPVSDPNIKKMPIKKSPTLGGLQLIKNHLELLLINILRDETEQNGENSTFLPTYRNGVISKKIINVLTESVHKRLKIENIAEELNYSKSYLFKTFKDQTGMTIANCFMKLKMEHAKELLSDSEMSVTEIAEHLCFDSQSYFTKSFKKFTSYSPSKYRRIFKTE